MKNNRIIIIVGTVVALIIFSITISISIINNKTNWSALKIGNQMLNELSFIEKVQTYNCNDIDCISKVNMYETNYGGSDWNISIEVFENNQKAEVRLKYLEWLNGEFKNTYSKDEYGFLVNNIDSDIIAVKDGNVLLLISPIYSDGKINLIKEAFKKVEEKYMQKEQNISLDQEYVVKNIEILENIKIDEINKKVESAKIDIDKIASKLGSCKETDLDNIRLQLDKYANINVLHVEYSEAVSRIEEKRKEFNAAKEDIVNNITTKLDEISKSLDSKELDKVVQEISKLKDTFYDSYKIKWNSYIDSIKKKIAEKEIEDYKKDCKTYSYKNVLRNPDDYKFNKAYWFGVVTQDIGYGSYRIGVDCSRNRFADSGYVCSNTIYVVYDGDEKLIEDDVVKLWGYMYGTKTYTSIFGASITIPYFVAKYITIQ